MYRSGNGRSPHNTNFEFQYMSKTVEKGRSAKTGQFVPIEYAQKHPDTTVVEKVKVGRQSTESDFRMCLDDVNRLGSYFSIICYPFEASILPYMLLILIVYAK